MKQRECHIVKRYQTQFPPFFFPVLLSPWSAEDHQPSTIFLRWKTVCSLVLHEIVSCNKLLFLTIFPDFLWGKKLCIGKVLLTRGTYRCVLDRPGFRPCMCISLCICMYFRIRPRTKSILMHAEYTDWWSMCMYRCEVTDQQRRR